MGVSNPDINAVLAALQGIQTSITTTGGLTGQGFTSLGDWNNSTTYVPRDVVAYNGSVYVCGTANTNDPPPSGNWTLWLHSGSTWYNGSGAPDNSVGVDGDYYQDTDTGNEYYKTGGTWGSPIANLTGPQGPTGTGPATVLTTPGLPGDGIADTGFTTGTAYFQYVGKAKSPITTCSAVYKVTGSGSGLTYAELAVFTGNMVPNGNASLTRRGYTDISGGLATGVKKTNVSLSGVTAGADLWVCFGCGGVTNPTFLATIADSIQSGVLQTASVQPSAASSPQATTLGVNTATGVRLTFFQ